MPSGPKRRKAAAKKKKQKETNNSIPTHSHGDDDFKVHDEKESDGGDTGSPTSQDHHYHQHEGEEEEVMEMEKREDTSSVRSIVADNEPEAGLNSDREDIQSSEMEGNRVIQIDWELEPEDDSGRKNGDAKIVESMKELHGGHKSQNGGTYSSCSSSDDESHVVEKNIVVIESGESKEEAPCLVEERTTFADLVKTADLPQVTQVTDDVSIMDSYNLVVDEAYDPIASKEDASHLVVQTATSADPVKTTDLPEVTQVTDGVPATDAYNLAVGEQKEEAYDPVAKHAFPVNLVDTADLPEVTQVVDSLPDIEAYNLVVEEPSNLVAETVPPADLETVSKDMVPVNYSTSYSTDSEFGLKENGNNDVSGVSPVVMDTGSQLVNDSMEMTNPTCSSDFGFALKENGENESSGLPQVVMDTGSQPKEYQASPTVVDSGETLVTDIIADIEAYSLVAEEPSNSLVETIPPVNSENLSEEVVNPNDSSPVQNPKCSGDFESGLKENGENEVSGVSPLVMDTRSQLVTDSTPIENPTCSSDSEFGFMENGKIVTSGVSPVVMVTESQLEEDKVLLPSTVEDIAVSSVANGSAAKEDKERLMQSSSVPPVGNSNDAENDKDYVDTECSDSRPLRASGPLPVQKTFWNGCCGLFELFRGSNA